MPAQLNINTRLISQEIDDILAKVLGQFLVQGSPTKHGGLRFLDIQSAKTFGFEQTREDANGNNLLIISAPAAAGSQERLEEKIRKGPHGSAKECISVEVRESRDAGKKRKTFVEVQYIIPTTKLIDDKSVTKYANEHGITTSEALKRILREFIIPMAREVMDHLIVVVREEP